MNMRWWMIFFRLDAITAAINHVFISTIRFGGISNKKRIETNIKRRSEVKRKKNSNARTREQNANFYTLIVYRSVQSIEKKTQSKRNQQKCR